MACCRLHELLHFGEVSSFKSRNKKNYLQTCFQCHECCLQSCMTVGVVESELLLPLLLRVTEILTKNLIA